MKILLIIFILFGFMSCKKDYVCFCETAGYGTSVYQNHSYYNIKETKKKAKESCNRIQEGRKSTFNTTVCQIK